MKCLNCDTDFISKRKDAKFCSAKCKLQFNRINKRINDTDNGVAGDTDNRTTKTDGLFEEHRPGYYNFGEVVYTRQCLICDKTFKTTLQMLKTCSPEHYNEVINSFFQASMRAKKPVGPE